jgi:hypothetical protein
MYGHLAAVVRIHHQAESCALKFSWQRMKTIHGASTLLLWNDRDIIHKLASALEHGAMVLERPDPYRPSFGSRFDEVITVAGMMVRALAVPLLKLTGPGCGPVTTLSALHAGGIQRLGRHLRLPPRDQK